VTLNQLVVRLTPHSSVPNKSDMDAFIATYKTFTTPQKLVRKLIQRYNVPDQSHETPEEKEHFNKMVVRTIQLRVCNLLKLLLTDYFADFDDPLLALVTVFVRGLSKSDRSYLTLSNILIKRVLLYCY
jgi:hypothetical protein